MCRVPCAVVVCLRCDRHACPPPDLYRFAFFDGLFDAIIEHVEEFHAFAGLTMSHKKYDYEGSNRVFLVWERVSNKKRLDIKD